jgi:exportin-1
MQHLFSVVTDTSHTAGLTTQATILAYMFYAVDIGKITVPLNPVVQTPTGQTNVQFVKDFVTSLLKTAFPHLNEAQIKITVSGFFQLDQDVPAFKEHLRDFLIQIRELSGEDDSDLFLEEREAALRKAEQEKREYQMSVPGILNPHEMNEEMQD